MKNFLGRLGLPRMATALELADAIERAFDSTTDIQSLNEAQVILQEETTRTYYERTHLQYEAINAALHCLNSSGATNSHRWTERLVEFDIEPEELLNP